MFENVLQQAERLARIEAHRTALRFVNGIDWLVRDPMIVVGRTPYDIVYRRDKLHVRRYRLDGVAPRHDLPVLLVPPLMVKPFIFDLYANRSLVAFLLRQGFRVYLVDFGEPDHTDSYVRIDDYVLDWMPAAARATRRDAGSSELSMLGYCMGGIFALMHAAANRDRSVRNIVSIGAPIDTAKTGLFAWIVKYGGDQLEFIARRIGNVPGGLSSTVFRMLTPVKNVTRYADLVMNLWDKEYVNGFDAMNQWVSQFIEYPQAAFVQFFHEVVRENKLVTGDLKFGRKSANLRTVEASLLAFAGRTDEVAPVPAVQAVMDAVGSRDKTFRLAPGGHMGVFAGATAPRHVWGPAARWLAVRSHADRQSAAGERLAETPRRARRAPRGVDTVGPRHVAASVA